MFARGGPRLFELLRQALSSTDDGYTQLAGKFDLTPYRTPDGVLDLVARRLLASGRVEDGLDVCCGTGAGTRMLKRVCTNSVVGVDRVPAMLDVARRNLGVSEPGPTVQFVQADALDLPFAQCFDLAVSFGAFGHIVDEDAFCRSVARALRPGGRFCFVTTGLPDPFSRASLYARGFNAAMRVRNALRRPPFIMYYLTFRWPEVRAPLIRAGFAEVEIVQRVGNARFPWLIVEATMPA